MRLRVSLALVAFAVTGISSFAQDIRITSMELRDQKFIIQYFIDDSNPNNEYKVSIYTNTNNYSAPITRVEGAVGEEVKPGLNTAIWNILDELGEYQGPLSIEIRASVFIPFIRLRNFNEPLAFKRGKSGIIEWKPGNTNPVHIELYREGTRLQGELNNPNNGSYTFNFNSDLKPGADYRIKITDSRSPDTFIYTSEIRIKRKTPGVLKGILGAGIGFAIYTFLGGDTGNSLPDPPILPLLN